MDQFSSMLEIENNDVAGVIREWNSHDLSLINVMRCLFLLNKFRKMNDVTLQGGDLCLDRVG